MAEGMTIAEGQTVTVPLRFHDDAGGVHAPIEDECSVEVGDEKVCTARIDKTDAAVVIQAKGEGQTDVTYRNEDGSVADTLTITVGEPAATNARFHVDGATFAPQRAKRKSKK